MFSSRLLACSLLCFYLPIFAFGATLSSDEVTALRDIATTLGKTNWNFSVDPCSGVPGWVDRSVNSYENNVTCDCSFINSTVCHVLSIVLKSQNLTGTLPKDLGRFPFLQVIDLTRNYLNGTIPLEWGAMKLVHISILGNRLTGPIPKEIGNITTLVDLTLEQNQLSGVLPVELGKLVHMDRMLLTSNYFTGQLPSSLAQLSVLTDFRIGDNNFTGPIPEFIGNWSYLQKLVIQGSGLSGPIPSGISRLAYITDLRISDLTDGTESPFPDLSGMKNLKTLILRSCNIVGVLPDYLGGLTELKVLDLCFNKLTGAINESFSSLANVQNLYLTGNLFNGTVPDWILTKGKEIDVSYNNFTYNGGCEQRSVNLFASTSMGNTSGLVSCLTSDQCTKNFYGFHINCGGKETTADGKVYEEDTDPAGASRFYQSKTNWAFSSTGNFLDDGQPADLYTETNTTPLSQNASSLYLAARLSPLSLTYYGYCLENGNYTVRLHFAEIRFTNDTTYNSLGRRIFDVYIQGQQVLKGFNIADEAGGFGKVHVKNFNVSVSSSTLEIRFNWAGKGTIAIPVKGVYGPLISAISVDSDFTPPSDNGSGTPTGIIVGSVAAAVALIILILVIFWWKGCLSKNTIENDLKGLDLQTGTFTLKQIKAATNNFDPANKIGEGGFGPVYKGLLSDGGIIAVKQLSSKSKQGNREFVNEIGMISALQHPHLVKLYGCCIEGNQLLLVYEYMENNSLARALFGPEEHRLNLDWPTRQKICIGIARGLAYLHEESRLKIVHRDIKATNVLLDKHLNPKISDFGLAKLDEEENTHISTRIAGTFGYMAPEYAMRGHLTDKADVYSFGIVALEIFSGRSNSNYRPKENSLYLLDVALALKENGTLLELADPRLGKDYNKEEAITMINVALSCTHASPTDRPAMSAVVSMLEGKALVKAFPRDYSTSSVSTDQSKIEMIRKHFEPVSEGETQTQSMSMDGPWTASTASTGDLYPVSLDSGYSQK